MVAFHWKYCSHLRPKEGAQVWAGNAFRVDFGSNQLLFPLRKPQGQVHKWVRVQDAFHNKIGANLRSLSLALRGASFASVALAALTLISPLDVSESSQPITVKPLTKVFI